MTPIKFDGFNCIYKGCGDVEDLPAQRKDGNVISRWQPTNAELHALWNGAAVEIAIAGGQPAIAVGVV